jgi:hypothetical protein
LSNYAIVLIHFLEKAPLDQLISYQSFLQNIITIQGVIVGVALPLSYRLVLSVVEKYDAKIADYLFEKLPINKLYLTFILNITLSIILSFYKITNTTLLHFVLIWFLANICVFSIFIKLIHSYSMELEKFVLNKLWNIANDFLED